MQTYISVELNSRSVRDDVMQAENLMPDDDISIMRDNQNWVSTHKDEIISRYKKLFNEINK